MEISASVKNTYNKHEVLVSTNGNSKTLNIPGKIDNYGSSVNGGEFYFLRWQHAFVTIFIAKQQKEI